MIGKFNRPAIASLALLMLLLIIAVFRQSNLGHDSMVLVQGGTVKLGGESTDVLDTLRQSEATDADELRSLLVKSHSYKPQSRIFIARHEVSNLQYRFFLNPMQSIGIMTSKYGPPGIDELHNFRTKSLNDIKYNNNKQPVVNVSFTDAYTFCNYSNMRLPSSDEFEAAFQFEMTLRQPKEMDYPIQTGNDVQAVVPLEVGKYATDHGALQEIIGNVMEWVSPEQGQHFLMGYSYKQYNKDKNVFLPWKRHYAEPDAIDNDFGFRCVYQPPTDFKPHLLQTPTVTRQGMVCYRTRDNLGPGRFDLLTSDNKRYYAGGMLLPEELCEIPQKTFQLGPNNNVTTVELLQGNPLGYTNYLLGKPAEEVKLADYYIDNKEVSIEDYHQFLNRSRFNDNVHAHPEQPKTHSSTPLNWTDQQSTSRQQEPVTGVSWWDAFAYCTWLNKRLPFSQEWEHAAKSGDGRIYAWGYDLDDNAPDVTPQGISGLSRTVSEWTGTFVLGSNSAIVKGGSELFDWRIFGRAYVELKVSRSTKSPAIGFRCAD